MTATTIRVQMAQRKDTAANWTAANPILLSGEIGYETDNKKFKIGDGITNWNSLAYLPIPDGSGNLTITGNLEIGSTGSLTFEGSTADGFETTLAVTNPTADRTITLPDRSGTVITSGDTGTVTSTMLADGTIVDADVNASAAIAGTKISPNFGSQTIQTTGIFSHALGTAGAPTVTFTGDTNTGIYSPGADQLALSTNGTGRLFVDASGRVYANNSAAIGPGAATPTRTLHLSDTTGQPAIKLTNDASGHLTTDGADLTFTGTNLFITNREAGAIVAEANGSERLRITSAGLVGVGTSSPGQLLDAQGNSNPQIKVSETNNSTSAGLFIENQGQRNWQLWADRSTDTFRLGNNSRATTNVAVDSTGRVGIGTTNPTSRLYVNGSNAVSNLIVNAGTTALSVYNDEVAGEVRLGAIDTSATNAKFLSFYTNPSGSSTGTERARIDSSGRLLVGTSSARTNFYNGTNTAQIQLEGTNFQNAAFAIVCNANSDDKGSLILAKNRGTIVGSNTIVQNGDDLGSIEFQGSDGTEFVQAANIKAEVDGTPGTNDMPGRIVFSTTADGASSPTERMRINADGTFRIGQTTTNTPGLGNTTTGIGFEPANGAIFLSRASGSTLFLNTNADSAVAGFYRSGTAVGSITVTTTATAYNTSSDYRLKENVTPVTDGIARLQQLKPSRFNFIADPDTTVDGFIAHEVQAVVPEAITGEKDAVDDDGNPIYQGIDQSKLVPLLTAALQEAVAKIESLEARLTAAGL